MGVYAVRVQVVSPDGEVLNQCGVSIPTEAVRAATAEGLTAFVAGLFGALSGDVAAIVREHAGGGGADGQVSP